MSNNDNIRMRDRSWSQHMWERIKTWLTGLDERVTDLEEGGGGGGGGGGEMNVIDAISFNGVNVPPVNKRVSMSETDPTVPSWAKAAQKPSYTAAEVGAKALQTAVSDPTASGEAITFIDSISQDVQGVIRPTKKTVRASTQALSGLMASTDKAKLDGIESGAQVNSITGVKGNAEASYRTGDVNLTPANIGALPDTTTAVDIGAVQNINIVNADVANAAALNAKLSQIPYSISPSLRGAAIAYVPQQVMRAITGVASANGGFGYIVRNGMSSFMFNVTSINGNIIYVFSLTSTESEYSHGTVYQYTGTAV